MNTQSESCTYGSQKNAYRLTRVRMSAYLGDEPSCAIKRGGLVHN